MTDDAGRRSPERAWRFVAWTFGLGWTAAGLVRVIAGPMGGPFDSVFDEPAEWAQIALSIPFFALPVIIALIMANAAGVRVRSWGLRMPSINALLIAPLVALVVAIVATALPIAFGISDFDPTGAGEVQRLAEAHSIDALTLQLELADDPQPVRSALVRGLLAGVLFGVLLAPIIELPWRGLVFTELSARGFAHAALVSAGLAALWWLPFWLLAGTGGFRSPSAVLAFGGAYALLGLPMAWARARTGSIVPGSMLAVAVSALSALPRLATAGGTHLQLELCALVAVALLAAGALLWPPGGADPSVAPGSDRP